jgi:hypothetical protein
VLRCMISCGVPGLPSGAVSPASVVRADPAALTADDPGDEPESNDAGGIGLRDEQPATAVTAAAARNWRRRIGPDSNPEFRSVRPAEQEVKP